MHLLFQQVICTIFAVVAIVSALMVITLNNPVRCVLFLVLTFIATAGMWIMAHAEFLALILVLVYVGAVMTLFLFVVMMINVEMESLKYHFVRYLPFGLLIVALLVALLMTAIHPEHFQVIAKTNSVDLSVNNTQQIGMVMYTTYVYAFELAAVLLLIAIISAIVLVHRSPRHSKQQQLRKQLMVRSKDRVHLVKMSSLNQED